MASDHEHRKFYYDWNEGKYKLSDEKIRYGKEVKPVLMPFQTVFMNLRGNS
jgi:hypothetical protein